MDTSSAGQAKARELESELQKAQEELDDFTLEHAIEVLTEQLDNEYNEYSKMIEKATGEIVNAIEELAKSFKVDTGKLKEEAEEKAKENTAEQKEQYEKDLTEAKEKLTDAEKEYNSAKADANSKANGKDSLAASEAEKRLAIAEEALKAAKEAIDEIENKIKNLPVYHRGGVVDGGKGNEVLIKAMSGEIIFTPPQLRSLATKFAANNFVIDRGKGDVYCNAPLVQLTCNSINKETIPEVKKMMNDAVDSIKRVFDAGLNRNNAKSSSSKFAKQLE